MLCSGILNIDASTEGTQLDFQPQDIKNTILVQLSWTHHRTIFSCCKTEEECEFYLRLNIRERYGKRELERQISAGYFELPMIGNTELSTLPIEIHNEIQNMFNVFC
ncbi:DUF1016 N-terminal domain-containing protein [Sphingobacterium tabacisoli]|uniref:DUF1016 N-terminal domain-containing protein n=1 Tax=Sphingobacterium tabacisoli TaxID=2044855 RepID=A0ABW5L455_9SPHI